MKKLLVLAIFGLMFAVTQATDRGYFPDVGYELSVTQSQPTDIMAAAVVDCNFALPEVNAILLFAQTKSFVELQTGIKTVYHNPDYGLNSTCKLNLKSVSGIKITDNRLVTTRHVS